MRPTLAPADFTDWNDLLGLIHASFAYMDGRIDPPSSAHALTPKTLRQRSKTEHLYLATPPLIGCAFFAEQPGALYIGKLAIASGAQGKGLGRAFIEQAEILARGLGLPRLRLETRIELVGNHAAFAALGFVRTAERSHPGYDRITSIVMEKPLSQSGSA
ncbi:GNAT family N-acetyltransferase [Puniceibacterium sediminis]|uniref:Acetyltransferase (GNAT) family protein n=1 Tax=Puniceibacterium sediminis TaxID=1608407 RepID=A0A238W3H9_9RHOB|nr:GNAT family N-acetyltransferase [Puniceibacterium sediminis]SNR41165.1 Acetyltransferase (GNAT) family protein [Puniceibacterium sediminis]